jgi:maltooligosyltrehalose trehalohydrolase
MIESAVPDVACFLLKREPEGYHSGLVAKAKAGVRYRLRLDEDPILVYPDPASRFQPDGPHGPSEVIDPSFPWTDRGWKGVPPHGQVIYEMHIGTFTKEGTWRAAAAQLKELASIGITVIEVMPVADFPGRFGWGYDGVDLFAPTWLYGCPEDFRAFVDAAHAEGVGVLLDVVYNHLGPDGNYLKCFSKDYFSKRHTTDWGEAINFDGESSGPVREMFRSNAAYWIEEFHLDGLRLDATQNVYDDGSPHILEEIVRDARERAIRRTLFIVAENEPQDIRLVQSPDRGGYGIDAMWNDDFHHSAVVALTGHNEAYYSDHLGRAQEFVSAAKYGFLYQGQWYSWQKQRRGSSTLGSHPASFVTFIENHDQVANSARGRRMHQITSPGKLRAMTALLLLGPATPMLFQGQEFASSARFQYFSDHRPEIAKLVYRGRGEFLSQFRTLKGPEAQSLLSDPGNPGTFEGCKLDFADRERHHPWYLLHKDLLRLRHGARLLKNPKPGGLDGAVLAEHAFVLRYFKADESDWLLIVNLGADLRLTPAPEPLLAPPIDRHWTLLFSTEDPKYGGNGSYSPETDEGWVVAGEAAVLLTSAPPSKGDEHAE